MVRKGKQTSIPLATLLKVDKPVKRKPLKPGNSGVFLTVSPPPNRNLHVLMGEKNADAKLRQSIARVLVEKSAPFRQGRKSGEDREAEKLRREQMRTLRIQHPKLTARQLYELPSAKNLRPYLTLRNFSNILSQESPRHRK